MAKVDEGAAMELALDDERFPRKQNRHVAVAVSHLGKRREALLVKRSALDREIAEIDAALEVLR